MGNDKSVERLFLLLSKAEAIARPPYKRHSAQRLERVHAVHSEIGKLVLELGQAEANLEEIYRKGVG